MAEYNSTEWKKGDKITSSKLNNIESGIANTLEVANSNSTKLDNIQSDITALTEAVDNLPGEHSALNDRVAAVEENFVSKAETTTGTNAQSKYNLVTNKVTTGNVVSTVWNEASGGGVQVKNPDANIVSFIGVNNGQNDNDIWAQFYAKFIANNQAAGQTANLGTRVNFTNHGVYYTKDKTSGAYTADDELITVGGVNALLDALLTRIATLEEKVASLEANGSVLSE